MFSAVFPESCDADCCTQPRTRIGATAHDAATAPTSVPHIAGKAQDRSLTETTTQQRRITRKSNRNSESRGQELVASSASRMTLVPTCCLTLEPSGLAEHQP